MSRVGIALLLGGAAVGGLLLLTGSSDKDEQEQDPAPEPEPQNSGTGLGIVPPSRGGSKVPYQGDRQPTEEEQLASFALEWANKDPAAFNRSLDLYKSAYAAWIKDRQNAARASAAWAAESNAILQKVGKLDPGFEAVGKVPVVGQIVNELYKIVRRFIAGDAEAKRDGFDTAFFRSNWKSGSEPEFTGYKNGVFWFRDMPVSAWAFSLWGKELGDYAKGIGASYLASLQALAVHLPVGYPVPYVKVQPDGSWFYNFNRYGNGDTSQAAIDRKEVFGLEVWSPKDITPTGPRGFNPAAPRAWIALGQKSNVLDLVSGTVPVPTGPLPVAPPIDPTAPLGSPTNPVRISDERGAYL